MTPLQISRIIEEKFKHIDMLMANNQKHINELLDGNKALSQIRKELSKLYIEIPFTYLAPLKPLDLNPLDNIKDYNLILASSMNSEYGL